MEDERARLLERIGALAGQINRHRSEQAGSLRSPHSSPSSPVVGYHPYHRGSSRGAYRGGYRGRGGGGPYRSQTLSVNSSVPSVSLNSPSVSAVSATGTPGTPSFITRTERHLQLINSNVYQSPVSARGRAIVNSREARIKQLQQRHTQDRARLRSYFRTTAAGAWQITDQAGKQYIAEVEGIKYIVAKGGSKLIKAELPGNDKPTPKVVAVGGVRFFRSKHGNLYRETIVEAQRHATRTSVPCRVFSTTGSCPKGRQCRFVHDFDRVSACKEYLQKGVCPSGDNCDLSHDLKPERTPSCLHYAKGNCSNPDCRYTHSAASLGAPVCRNFGLYGYCDKGAECGDRHVYECPDYSNTGECTIKGCKLLHRERASVLRKKQERQDNDEYTDEEDDGDDQSVNSDEFDSDVEELFHNDDDSEFDPDQDMITL